LPLTQPLRRTLGTRHHQRNNQAVQAEGLGENQNQDHTNEQLGLLGGGADTRVTNNANSCASREAGEANGQA
jgi:hypothetical protein